MLRYRPGETFVHGLDPRAKLCFQFGLAIAAAANPTPAWVLGLTLVGGLTLAAGRVSPLSVVRSYRALLVVLALGPLFGGVALGPPWFRVGPAVDSLWAVGRVVPVLLVSAVYVWTTPIRETRAAIQWLVPGRVGRLFGVGVSLVFRLLPAIRGDVARVREAMTVRLGSERSVFDRARRLGVRGLQQSFLRADRLSLALRARCFAWNPTLPDLRLSLADYVVIEVGLLLAVSPWL
jgi:biotin transport system permease protein